jgi:hypothetical protein
MTATNAGRPTTYAALPSGVMATWVGLPGTLTATGEAVLVVVSTIETELESLLATYSHRLSGVMAAPIGVPPTVTDGTITVFVVEFITETLSRLVLTT